MTSTQITSSPGTGLGAYLRKFGLSVQVVADDARMEHSHVWRIVKGERTPSVTTFAKLATALGMSLDQLYAVMYSNTQN